MKSVSDPELEVKEGNDELDAGWDEPAASSPKVTSAASTPPAAPSVGAKPKIVSIPAAPADEIDEGWDEDDEDDEDEDEDASEPVAASGQRTSDVRPREERAPRAVEAITSPGKRALSKRERRELERKARSHATRKTSENRRARQQSRREEARVKSEQRIEERRAEFALAEKRRKKEQRKAAKARVHRVEEPDEVLPSLAPPAGTKRGKGKTERTKGRPKKQTGGGWIIALIALITLATGLYAWSKR